MEFIDKLLTNFISIPILVGYAEIHYHLKFLYPRYFRKEPEIIADLPRRCIQERSSKIPILLIVKDANIFPVKLKSANILIIGKSREETGKIELDLKLNNKYFSKIFYVDISKFKTDQWLNISVEINYQIKGRNKTAINDNYPAIAKKPFRCFWAEKELPFPKDWYCGDPHYHSIHTSDQVEFGADIFSTKIMAKSMGLDWFFVTDHSYDLDDDENDCTRNDPELPIWKKMQQNCKKNDEKDFRVIAGEEVSIGNWENKNVHLLAINHPHFIAGSGDSAEKWFRNKPQNSLKMIKRLHSENNLFIAAHPFENVPRAQKLTLRRGQWHSRDYENAGIKFLQVINSNEINDIQNSIERWTKLLLQDKKYYIFAGNDAHGNFNVMRQIKSPFWKLFSSCKQTFGNFFTAFNHSENEPLTGIQNKNIIVSNGPFLSFKLIKDKQEFRIGSTIHSGSVALIFDAKTSPEFGEIVELNLFIADLTSKVERKFSKLENSMAIVLSNKGYLRMSMTTEKGGMVYTNPIWVE
ncbi:MAG: CehA/McbA family metallohydrolase [Candidatus Cloacimonetes bacterium]|nr:CehA/McbA family metallohydrolase [Candidatus Cloacimonadota bacterium]MCF7812915.1 CehA/McbA family metallohydrolase [Candidatus Cloacimonadota bacterium]MCF7867127.1 CehA/McbA family metallohydrolase [Candidatus Cloacimonadota bacterium]MCF7882553.1 CehA/McbA family metallohydrolase [Candidatus Cloacimonadota bacterium]